jgi:hypothetical protein
LFFSHPVGAVNIKLLKKDLEEIDEITTNNAVAGLRSPESMIKSVNL